MWTNSYYLKKFHLKILTLSGLLKFNSVRCRDIVVPRNMLKTLPALSSCKPLCMVYQLHHTFSCGANLAYAKAHECTEVNDYEDIKKSYFCTKVKKLGSQTISVIPATDITELSKTSVLNRYDELNLVLANELMNAFPRSFVHCHIYLGDHKEITEQQVSVLHSLASYSEPWQSSHVILKNTSSLLKSDLKLTQNPYETNPKNVPDDSEKPSEDQLLRVLNRLSDMLPKFFVDTHDLSLYHKDIVFQNNIRGVITRGITSYYIQILLMKIYGHMNYAHVKAEILKITHHIEDGTVRVRWRVSGVSGTKVFMFFWKHSLVNWRKRVEKDSEWLDGYSVFTIGNDGLIHKHICDKLMPDDEKLRRKRNSLTAKLSALLSPRSPRVNGLNTIVAFSSLAKNCEHHLTLQQRSSGKVDCRLF